MERKVINYEEDTKENETNVKINYDEEKQIKEYFQILFHCDKCPTKFTLLNGLRAHKRTHTEIRVDSCNICRKLFMQKCESDKHKEQTSQFSVEYCHPKIFQNGQVEGRSFVAKKKQNFIFEVF